MWMQGEVMVTGQFIDHQQVAISYVIYYVISTYSPSLQSFNLAVLLYVNFYTNKVK